MNGRAVGPLITGVTISRGFTGGQEDGWAFGPTKQRYPSESGAFQLKLGPILKVFLAASGFVSQTAKNFIHRRHVYPALKIRLD